jgi:hypothetical protein
VILDIIGHKLERPLLKFNIQIVRYGHLVTIQSIHKRHAHNARSYASMIEQAQKAKRFHLDILHIVPETIFQKVELVLDCVFTKRSIKSSLTL